VQVDERPAVEVEQLRPKIAGEPRVTGQHHQRPDAALAAPLPRDQPAHHKHEADDSVGQEEGEVARLVRDPFRHGGHSDRADEQPEPQKSQGR
jgi:hypothetical protein